MEQALTKQTFLEKIEDLLAVETVARDGYGMDIITFKNFEIVDTLRQIKDDEDRHIKLLKEIIEILNGGKART
jgi:rubrerythrin